MLLGSIVQPDAAARQHYTSLHSMHYAKHKKASWYVWG